MRAHVQLTFEPQHVLWFEPNPPPDGWGRLRALFAAGPNEPWTLQTLGINHDLLDFGSGVAFGLVPQI